MSDATVHFRTAIVGAKRQKVAKVISLLKDLPPLQDRSDEPDPRQIHVEYIPCVATFESYQNENGEPVRYLAKLEYHGEEGLSKGSSLAPFFDEQNQKANKNNDLNINIRIPGINVVAIGCGLESEEDVSMISSFIHLLSGNEISSGVTEEDEKGDEGILIKCIKPNEEFSSMEEETIAYKNLSPEEKEQVTTSQLIGPGKMAKFAMELATECIPRSKKAIEQESEAAALKEKHNRENENEVLEQKPLPLPMPKEYDPNTTRFACKMCRTVLFNEDDLEDPPHSQSQHEFSRRKTKSGINTNGFVGENKCQSKFLADGLDWMGDISQSHEGKLSCPKCHGKLGLYKWHGTQCSCGTWVVPAIMIHKSRVDVVNPTNEEGNDPLALLLNPLARLHIGGQSK